jgi:hypothetical protein
MPSSRWGSSRPTPAVHRRSRDESGNFPGVRRSATAKVGRSIIVDQGWTSVGRQLRMALFESERSNAPSRTTRTASEGRIDPETSTTHLLVYARDSERHESGREQPGW